MSRKNNRSISPVLLLKLMLVKAKLYFINHVNYYQHLIYLFKTNNYYFLMTQRFLAYFYQPIWNGTNT